MAKRTYTADEILRALAIIEANRGSLKAASRDTGIARSTLREWRNGRLPAEVRNASREQVEQVGRKAAEEFRRVGKLYLTNLERSEVVQKTSAKDSALVVGILEDKAVRAEGGATSRVEQVKVSLIAPDALSSLSMRVIEASPNGAVVRRADGQPGEPEPLMVIAGKKRSEDEGAA